MLLLPPLPPPRAVPAALPLPAHPRPYFSVNGPKLPPAEPLPLFAKPKDRPTFEQLLAARTGPRVRRRSPLVGAMVDAVGIQVIILTMTMVIRTMGH